jgi:hypothetical protein
MEIYVNDIKYAHTNMWNGFFEGTTWRYMKNNADIQLKHVSSNYGVFRCMVTRLNRSSVLSTEFREYPLIDNFGESQWINLDDIIMAGYVIVPDKISNNGWSFDWAKGHSYSDSFRGTPGMKNPELQNDSPIGLQPDVIFKPAFIPINLSVYIKGVKVSNPSIIPASYHKAGGM